MRKMWKKALAAALSLAMVASSFTGFAAEVQAAETGTVTAEVKGNSVVIENGYISREFSTADDKLSTVKITNKRTDGGDTVFTPAAGSEEFIIKVAKDATASAPVSLPGLDRTGWTAKADSYHNASGASDGPASNLLDGNVQSIWHSAYSGSGQTSDESYPHNVVINMKKEVTFKSFSYTPRQEGEGTNGNILGYELWASTSSTELGFDAEGWSKIASGKFEYNGVNPIYVNLAKECTATQLKFVATSSNNGQQFAGGAEFNLHADAAPVETNTRSFAASDLELAAVPVVEPTTAVINNVEKSGQKVTFTFKPFEYKDATWNIKEVVVMYDGDHYMRKFMEIELDKEDLAIDYIDLESFNVEGVPADAQWTIPTNAGGIVQMDTFKANLGQPIYVDGMFFGAEFPATDTQIVDNTGYIRYYTGKTFEQFKEGNQLTTDGKYVTWQTVAGAARSATDLQVIQADFFEYIYDIATPSDFRIQYNSWFDNMMLISDETILESFIEMDRELNKVETRPLDSYVVDDGWINYNDTYEVDPARAGKGLNTEGFWAFNSKFPNGLTTSSDLVHKFGSNFGVWVGPRGGYNFYGHLANIIEKAGKGSKAGGSIDVADSVYHENLTELFTKWQKDYGVNYWKWDGFADSGQYGAFAAQDGVPGYKNSHMTGGYKGMYHVTDLWEGWIDIFEAVRKSEKDDNINKLWLSLTCYVHPSPWFLQWANSVWIQCIHDQADAGSSSSKMDRQLTYRDACYYDFVKNHQFQFPLANVYNHDPVYGKEGTGMNKNTATDEQFQNYLYAQSARGTAFWELYFSDSLMTDGKYEVTGEFLAWAEANHNMLKNAKMFGGDPMSTVRLGSVSGNGTTDAYGFAGFDGYDGIITIRNSAQTPKTLTMTFDRALGVPEDAETLKYHLEHTHNLTAGTPTTGEFKYGETYTFTLQADEVRMFRVSKDGDTTAPEFARAFSDGGKVVTVKFNEKVTGNEFTVAGATVETVEQSADDVTYRITLAEALADNATVEVTAGNIKDLAGNACTDTISFVNYKGNVVAKGAAAEEESLMGDNGFTVAAIAEKAEEGTLVAQGNSYALGINADGFATFTVNGVTAVSDTAVADGDTIVGVKENNGIMKLYVNSTLAGSAYKADNRFFTVTADAITVANAADAIVHSTAFGYDTVADVFGAPGAEEEDLQIPAESMTVTASSTDTTEPAFDKSPANVIDGDASTFWATAPGTTLTDAYYMIELDDVYTINQVDYTKRYDSGAGWGCTGNLLDYVIEVSTDGETWTQAAAGDTIDGTTVITFEEVEAKYVKLTATKSYHWQEANANTIMTVAELAVYKAPAPEAVKINPEILAKNAMANSEQLPAAWDNDGGAAWAFDEEPHWWHSRYDYWDQKGEHEVGSVEGDGKPSETNPIWIQTGFDGAYKVDRIEYLGRDNRMGGIKDYTVSVALLADPMATPTDADFTAVKSGSLECSTDVLTIQLDEPVAATHVRITVTETYDAYNGGAGDGHLAAQNIAIFGYPVKGEITPPEPPVVEKADKTALEAALEACAAIDANLYTEESVAAVLLAATEGQAVLAKEDATQAEVDAAVAAIEEAVAALVEKEEPPVVEEEEVARVSGTTRYETGYKVADALKETLGVEKFDAVVVATGKNFADALAGSYLAVQKNAPIILTNGKDDNIAQLHEYIAANVAAGGKVYILGGEGAVPAEVAAIDGYDVVRLSGKSRYETNLAILTEAGVAGDSIIVATGKSFADSLSASAAKLPILLVKPEAALTEEAKAVLGGMKNIYIIGGEGAVSADIAAELAAFGEVTRVSGATRYETSVAVAKTFFTTVENAVVASGKNFPDGLCGGPLAAAMNAPLILTADGKTDAAAGYMAENAIASGYVLGGSGALADESVTDVFALESADDIVLK